jgi:phosphate transport system substrate-binding protein
MRTPAYLLAGALALAAPTAGRAQGLKGDIKIDGSSTVYLITQAMATKFNAQHPDVKITVGLSGTGGGFKKFSAGETDINDASRAIHDAEAEACKKNGIGVVGLQVAWDGIAVVVHPDNTWARKMTVEQLRQIWHPDSAAKKWSDVDPKWPNETIKLFGTGADSGTHDFFTEKINGKEKLIRKDYEATADPNIIARGVEGNKYALGYMGLAYYEANKDKLGLVAVADKKGDPYVQPSTETVLDGTYKPLSRPLFIYIKKESLKRPEVKAFAEFYLRRDDLVAEVKYVKMNTRQANAQKKKLDEALKSLGN